MPRRTPPRPGRTSALIGHGRHSRGCTWFARVDANPGQAAGSRTSLTAPRPSAPLPLHGRAHGLPTGAATTLMHEHNARRPVGRAVMRNRPPMYRVRPTRGADRHVTAAGDSDSCSAAPGSRRDSVQGWSNNGLVSLGSGCRTQGRHRIRVHGPTAVPHGRSRRPAENGRPRTPGDQPRHLLLIDAKKEAL